MKLGSSFLSHEKSTIFKTDLLIIRFTSKAYVSKKVLVYFWNGEIFRITQILKLYFKFSETNTSKLLKFQINIF